MVGVKNAPVTSSLRFSVGKPLPGRSISASRMPALSGRLPRRLQNARRLRDELRKRRGIGDGQLGKNFPVDVNPAFIQAFHESVVAGAVGAAGRADARNPE